MTRWSLGLALVVAALGCRPDPGYRDADWQDEREPQQEACDRYVGYAEDAADATGLPVALIMGVMRVESGYREDAESHAGAVGLMQIMPGTGDHFGCDDLYDAEVNVACGARVLADYTARVGGDVQYGLAAYNAGLANAKRWKKAGAPPANLDYVRRVLLFTDLYEKGGCAAMGSGTRAWESEGRTRTVVTHD
jgi:soluble lytic murein transglycosylase-like protein